MPEQLSLSLSVRRRFLKEAKIAKALEEAELLAGGTFGVRHIDLKFALWVIDEHAREDESFAGQQTLADEMEIPLRTLQRLLAVLDRLGLITKRRKARKTDGKVVNHVAIVWENLRLLAASTEDANEPDPRSRAAAKPELPRAAKPTPPTKYDWATAMKRLGLELYESQEQLGRSGLSANHLHRLLDWAEANGCPLYVLCEALGKLPIDDEDGAAFRAQSRLWNLLDAYAQPATTGATLSSSDAPDSSGAMRQISSSDAPDSTERCANAGATNETPSLETPSLETPSEAPRGDMDHKEISSEEIDVLTARAVRAIGYRGIDGYKNIWKAAAAVVLGLISEHELYDSCTAAHSTGKRTPKYFYTALANKVKLRGGDLRSIFASVRITPDWPDRAPAALAERKREFVADDRYPH